MSSSKASSSNSRISSDIPVLRWKHFTRVKTLGSGSEGAVYLMSHDLQQQVAVKIFARHNNTNLRELGIVLNHTRHPHIVQFFGYVIDERKGPITGYVMEYMAGSSLDSVIHNVSFAYENKNVVSWGKQASLALGWLHSQGIIHRDVKPQNMLLSGDRNTLKICDFGMTREVEQNRSMTLCVGTILYMAPELLNMDKNKDSYDEKCDVYSMGVSLWEMMTRKVPFYTIEMSMLALSSYIARGGRPPIFDVGEQECRNLIERCFSTNPAIRPTMKQLEISLANFEAGNPSQSRPGILTAEQDNVRKSQQLMRNLGWHNNDEESKKMDSPEMQELFRQMNLIEAMPTPPQ